MAESLIVIRKNRMKNLVEPILYTIFAPHFCNGTLADRLGNGLQNRVEQFDSARYLQKVTIDIFSRL